MLRWVREKLRDWNTSPLGKWSVRFDADDIETSDGLNTKHRLPIRELRKVVVQTDDSGPCGVDVLYFLFTEDQQPAAVFPIEARGCQGFVRWAQHAPTLS